jgi:tocopherol cyclase
MYHGHGLTHDFFEGWYFKFADAAERQVWAVIPGVFLAAAQQPEQESHAFVQTLNGQTAETHYYRFPLSAFSAAPDTFDVRIGPNQFTATHLALDLAEAGQSLRGELRFENPVPWPVTLTSPGIMGWYALAPFMECYHGVVSLDHPVSGQLALNGESRDFGGGRGYIEKDWGQAFPRSWIWMQTNHFAQPGTSFTASVAHIPWLGAAFRGFLAGLWHAGRLYRFATYTGAAITRLSLTDTRVEWQIHDHRYNLDIEAKRGEGGLLHAPLRTAMLQRVLESLTAEVSVRLSERRTGREIFAGTGRHAGLEVGGEAQALTKA